MSKDKIATCLDCGFLSIIHDRKNRICDMCVFDRDVLAALDKIGMK